MSTAGILYITVVFLIVFPCTQQTDNVAQDYKRVLTSPVSNIYYNLFTIIIYNNLERN